MNKLQHETHEEPKFYVVTTSRSGLLNKSRTLGEAAATRYADNASEDGLLANVYKLGTCTNPVYFRMPR